MVEVKIWALCIMLPVTILLPALLYTAWSLGREQGLAEAAKRRAKNS